MNVLMLGPGFDVKGGISSVVRVYWSTPLTAWHDLTYVSTHCDGSGPAKLAQAIMGLCSFFRALITKRIDIVHVHSASRASFYRKSVFVLLAALLGKKIVLHVHGGEFLIFYFEECGALRQWYIRFIFNRAHRIIALSDVWRENLTRIVGSGERITVISNPVPLPAFAAHRRGASVTVLFMGRLGAQKGVFDLIEAARGIDAKRKKVIFVCCGDGDLEQVRAAIHERRLDDSFVLPGWVTDTAPYYRNADIFVLPSYNECMPMSILEAAGYGLPMVATRVGGVPEMIEDGVGGFLVDPGDRAALGDRLERLIDSAALRKKMGGAARALVMKKYDVALVVAQLDALYKDLMRRERTYEKM